MTPVLEHVLRPSLRDVSLRRRLFLASAVLPLFLAIGLYAFWPMIRQEVERRQWWENVWSFSEDAVAVFWYFRFVVPYLIGDPQSTGRSKHRDTDVASEWRRVAISMAVGAAMAICSAAWAFHAEKSSYLVAAKTVAAGRCTNHKAFSDSVHYRIDCHFADSTGAEHKFWVIAVDARAHPPAGYPVDVVEALRHGIREFPVPIRYDPSHPQRAWIEGTGGIDENGVQWASLVMLMFQMMGLAVFALKFLPRLRDEVRRGTVPWWVEIYKVMPLALEAICLGVFGFLELAVGRML
jgi:hypothetical protein